MPRELNAQKSGLKSGAQHVKHLLDSKIRIKKDTPRNGSSSVNIDTSASYAVIFSPVVNISDLVLQVAALKCQCSLTKSMTHFIEFLFT